MGLTTEVRRAVATAPVRVGDVGGWTDTWFGSPGQVCHLAVGPGVVVEATLVEGVAGPGLAVAPVRILAPMLFEDYRTGPSPDRGWRWPIPGRQPLLEHAVASVLEEVAVPPGRSVELRITSEVPAGASLGTSGAVVVAVLAALDAVLDRTRSPAELAAAAHSVETHRTRRESGVQDQWAAALGGCGLLAIGPYPEVRHRVVPLAADTITELGARLVTVVFGPHDSSAVHAQVIDSTVGCGG
ncbi:MAG: mevalonate kinase, partial [Acidimicrobiales bacterium]|nr:mevalonate kinase [Acidimicrobiales bacterium]